MPDVLGGEATIDGRDLHRVNARSRCQFGRIGKLSTSTNSSTFLFRLIGRRQLRNLSVSCAVVGLSVFFIAGVHAQIRFTIERFSVSGENPIDDRTTQDLLAPFVGEQEGLEGIESAREALANALRDRGFMFHRVYTPQQKLGGVVEFVVARFGIEDLVVKGNEYFETDNVLRSLPSLQVGSTPNTRELSRNMETVNRNPVKDVDLKFSAGRTLDRMRVEVNVADDDPERFFATLNNTGSETTGEERVSVGYQHANLFDRDHVFTATYATSPSKIDDVVQFGAFYQVPLYHHGGILNLLAAYSDTDSGTVAGVFDVRGKGTVIGGSYTRLFPRRGKLVHWLELGLVDKGFDNDIEFEDQPLGVDVSSAPVYARYVGEHETDRAKTTYYLGVAANTGFGGNNDQSRYEMTRFGADERWTAMYAGGSREVRVGRFALRFMVDGQYSGEPLIPGEQFGLGGITNDIRGFEEREAAGDNGIRFNAELWFPKRSARSASTLLFLDGGYVELENPQPGDNFNEELISVGIGFRWYLFDKLNLELDLGHVLNGVDENITGATRDGDEKIHFNVIYRF